MDLAKTRARRRQTAGWPPSVPPRGSPGPASGEESPGSTETGCRVTPGGGDPRESATESKPPSEAPEVSGLGHEGRRSEEHTSELQSLMRISYAVFCLKKKKKQKHLRTNKDILKEKKLKKTITSNILNTINKL